MQCIQDIAHLIYFAYIFHVSVGWFNASQWMDIHGKWQYNQSTNALVSSPHSFSEAALSGKQWKNEQSTLLLEYKFAIDINTESSFAHAYSFGVVLWNNINGNLCASYRMAIYITRNSSDRYISQMKIEGHSASLFNFSLLLNQYYQISIEIRNGDSFTLSLNDAFHASYTVYNDTSLKNGYSGYIGFYSDQGIVTKLKDLSISGDLHTATQLITNQAQCEVETPTDDDDESSGILWSWIFGGFSVLIIVLSVVIGCVGLIDSRCIRYNDVYNLSYIIVFGLYSADFWSDICFASLLLFEYFTEHKSPVYSNGLIDINIHLLTFILSIWFLFFPMIFSMYQLRKEVFLWMNDQENGGYIVLYLGYHSRLLYCFSLMVGSGFGAISLLNSALFRLNILNMGLKKHQIIKFRNKRLTSVVVMENVPQLILQSLEMVLSRKEKNVISIITITAFIFSSLSIVASLFEYSLQNLSTKSHDLHFTLFSLKFDVVSSEIYKHRNAFKYQQKKLNANIAQILNMDRLFIEQLRAINIGNGLQLKFRIHVSESLSIMHSYIKDTIEEKIQNGDLVECIKHCWKLRYIPGVVNLVVEPITPLHKKQRTRYIIVEESIKREEQDESDADADDELTINVAVSL